MPPVLYEPVPGVERLDMYEPGGYHPIMIDDVLHQRYCVVDKLGYGGYSTVWLAYDNHCNRHVAIKVGVSATPHLRRESSILRQLASSIAKATPAVLDEFEIQGPNGTHACYVTDATQGSLYEAKFSRLSPIQVARVLATKLVLAVASVHSQGFVLGDIRLGNVLLKLPDTFNQLSVAQFRDQYGDPERIPVRRIDQTPLPPNVPAQVVVPLYLGKKAQDFTTGDAQGLILADFGESFRPAVERRLGKDNHIPLTKRAPEAFFEPDAPLSFPSDIWSLGNAIWDVLGMRGLFCELEPAAEVCAEHMDVLGTAELPDAWPGAVGAAMWGP